MPATVRSDILKWFADNAGERALIGGHLKSSKQSLDAGIGHLRDVRYCYEEGHRHGDLVVSKGVAAESMACHIDRTSDAHRMCIVSVPLGSAAKPVP